MVATGAWTPLLNRELGCRVPIQPGKGYSITMPRPALCPTFPLIFEEHRVAVTPFASGYRLGSTMEFAGYDDSLNRSRLAILTDAAKLYLKDPLAEPVEEEWWGWRPMTFDGLPVIDRAPAASNVLIAAGHNMLGLSMATATGKLVAELLAGAKPHIDPAAVLAHAILTPIVLTKARMPRVPTLRGMGLASLLVESRSAADAFCYTLSRSSLHWSSLGRRDHFFSTTSTSPTSMYCPPPVCWQWTAIDVRPGLERLAARGRQRHLDVLGRVARGSAREDAVDVDLRVLVVVDAEHRLALRQFLQLESCAAARCRSSSTRCRRSRRACPSCRSRRRPRSTSPRRSRASPSRPPALWS